MLMKRYTISFDPSALRISKRTWVQMVMMKEEDRIRIEGRGQNERKGKKTNYKSDFNFPDKMTMNHDEIFSSEKNNQRKV